MKHWELTALVFGAGAVGIVLAAGLENLWVGQVAIPEGILILQRDAGRSGGGVFLPIRRFRQHGIERQRLAELRHAVDAPGEFLGPRGASGIGVA